MIKAAHLQIHSSHQSPHRQSFFNLFTRLPFDIQEDIIFYLNPPDLHSLSLAAIYLASVAARALFSNVVLLSAPTSTKKPLSDLRPCDTLRKRQFSFVLAISQHPQYAKHVRNIAFEFLPFDAPRSTNDHLLSDELIWSTLSKCTNVYSMHIKMAANKHDADLTRLPTISTPIFPNLKHAKIEGTFPLGALDRLLLHHRKDTQLRSLHVMGGTGEYVRVSGLERPSWSLSLSGFIARSVQHKALRQVRQLTVQVDQSPRLCVTPASLSRWLDVEVTPHLESLTLMTEAISKEDEAGWNEWLLEDIVGRRELKTVKYNGEAI